VKLSIQADYAVRAVYELARRGPGSLAHTEDIAGAQGVPASALAKVVQDLARAGVVRTQRGQRGGVTLARDAGRITVLQVIEAIEGPVELCRCRMRVHCDTAPCEVHDLWSSLEDVLTRELDEVTFAALIERRETPAGGAAHEAGRR
jgi:Rrf2 family protein